MTTRIPIVLVLALVTTALTGCGGPGLEGAPQDVPRTGSIQLDGVEVREYQGEKLGSVEDFRENSIKGPQDVDTETYRLRVTGLVGTPSEYTYSEVTSGYAAYEKVVQLDCVEGWSVNVMWKGVLVSDLIRDSAVKGTANTVVFKAVDGYSTALPLSYIEDNKILLAYGMNGVTIPPVRGYPFQLVAEDKWGYKWIKWVTEIELSDDPAYRGYWETRGFSNSGDRDKSEYEE